MAAERTEPEVLFWLRGAVADLLGVEADEVDPERPLSELGISSRDAVGLVGELEDYLDRDLDATLVWRTSTIAALARLLAVGGLDGELPELHQPPTFPTSTEHEPIAIIGLGARFPGGAEGPDGFWELLREGRDAVGTVPDGRWDPFTASSSTGFVAGLNRTGGFLPDIAGFDAAHFAISPREAVLMDPQQRMLLEVFVEALDHAGLDAEALRGSDTGVFVGMSTNEYSHLAAGDLDAVDGYLATGSAFSIAANRISYLYDLRGPSVTLDTACSSSLVAMHQAVRSIRSGEVTTAVVGGVNLLLSPATTVTFSQAGALAPAGGCKPFSDDADGIARAEGCGVVVLKRLSDAERDGDRVLGLVAGSAVNSDGRSNGLTAPNPEAQEAVLVAAYADAGLPMAGVDYVEAHGTGTLLGDPIEAGALGATLGADRPPDRPLLIGSVKSNLGHPESAAGVAGVIKVVLGLRHDVVPASIKYRGPNPHIRFDDWRLAVVEEPMKWPRHTGRAIAGVSGFGFGGTNAHVVITEYRGSGATVHDHGEEGAVVLPLAGSHPSRVRDNAARLAGWLEGEGRDVPLAAVASTLTRRRSQGTATAVVAGRGRAGLAGALRRFAAEQRPAADECTVRAVPRTTTTHPDTDRAVWVFSGFGQFWPGMGARLLAEEPAFATAVDELEPLVREHAGFSLRAALDGTRPAASLNAVQVATFGLQVALAALWRSYGVQPAAVVGHSVGEIPAAVVAGAITLEDGVRLICLRSYLVELGESTGAGGMAVVELTEPELADLAAEFPGVDICVYSSATQLTVGSADAAELARLVEHVESLGRSAFPLPVRGAAHSPMVDPYLPTFLERLGPVSGRPPRVRFVSTALPDGAEPTFDQHYWAANVRNPVRFAQVVQRLAAEGHPAFLEISAHPVAGRPISQSVTGVGGFGTNGLLVLPSLRRDGDDVLTFRASALALHRAGLEVDLDRLVPPAPQVDLPRAAWRHRRFWVETVAPVAVPEGHPLLGVHVELPEGGRHLWRADVGTTRLPWLDDHRVGGVPVLPVAAYAELALAAAREVLAPDAGPAAVVLDDLALMVPMTLGEHTDVTTSLLLTGPGRAAVEVFARPPGASSGTPPTRHATATVALADEPGGSLDLGAPTDTEPVDLYAAMRAAGHEYGPAFLGVGDARLAADGLATARVGLPPTVAPTGPGDGWTVHPVLLDVCLQTLAVSALALGDAEGFDPGRGTLVLPVGVGRVRVLATPGPEAALATARIAVGGGADGDRLTGSVRVTATDGTPLIEVRDVVLQRIDAGPPLPEGLDDGWPGAEGLRALPAAEARQLLADRLRDRVAVLMGYQPEDVDPTVSLGSLGVDSLIAMRARNAVETDCGISVPVQLLLQGGSLGDLEAYLAGELGLAAEAPLGTAVAAPRGQRDVEARDGVERWLVATWHTATGRQPAGVTAPLATLGDGAAAGRFADAVLERLGGLPAASHGLPRRATLLAAADIQAQAELVREIIEDGGDSPVRVLAPGRPGHRPLFLFHPAGATTSVYHPLVSQLGDDVPVYGFDRLAGLVGIDDKVTQYLEWIKQLQPAGPYRLGGWSFGGALSYRTAQRLRAAGEPVETLFMIDTILPNPSEESEQELLRGRFERFLEYLHATYGVTVDVDLHALVRLPEPEQITTLYRLAEESGANLSPALMEHQRTSYEDARIAEKYSPQSYGPGRVVLYRSTDRGLTTTIDPRYARTEDTLGWDAHCPDLEVVLVPGTHTSIIDRPRVDVMAAHLSGALGTVVGHAGR